MGREERGGAVVSHNNADTLAGTAGCAKLTLRVRILEPFGGEVTVELDLADMAVRDARACVSAVGGGSHHWSRVKTTSLITQNTKTVRDAWMALNGKFANGKNKSSALSATFHGKALNTSIGRIPKQPMKFEILGATLS